MSENAPHYFVITVGTTGDVHPFMRIASALQTLGRKVTFITHSYYENVVRGDGLPFVGIGTDEEFQASTETQARGHASTKHGVRSCIIV